MEKASTAKEKPSTAMESANAATGNRSEGPPLNSHGREAVDLETKWPSAVRCATEFASNGAGPRPAFDVLNHGLTPVATKCRIFSAVQQLKTALESLDRDDFQLRIDFLF